ncbi:HAD-IIIA family hydrolase [Sulfurimonas sp. HSL-1656]|uniref:KdsC family phosphatase n=1 Tax=Thiomicrolovo subterrani TaxID=3131934 RepID=UPI0031F8BD44
MIKLLVLDVDGCLTNGQIIYGESGEEIKAFNVKDGLAIKSWMRLGHEVAIITGRRSGIVKRRADELGILHLYQGVKDKRKRLEMLCSDLDIDVTTEVAAIGDDLNDLKMLELAAVSFAPADASSYITGRVDHVLARRGGEAAVREMIEALMRRNGEEEAFLAQWQ